MVKARDIAGMSVGSAIVMAVGLSTGTVAIAEEAVAPPDYSNSDLFGEGRRK